MACTTLLVGKKASNDNTTMITRTDDGHFEVKRITVVNPDQQPRIYKSALSHVEIKLPDNPIRYTSCPNVDPKKGIWAATGINEANVGMTATETITSNPRVLSADPLVELHYEEVRPAENADAGIAEARQDKNADAGIAEARQDKNSGSMGAQAPAGERVEIPGGIGEEDMVVLVLPYIHTAREGVERLGSLLEQYGTYESNGIAFNDENEVWWLESIGGHHWLARRVRDDEVVLAPNRFGMDRFDFEDAYGEKKENLCSADLKEFVETNHLNLNKEGEPFNPRYVFGSHTDLDHIYNNPRAWFIGRYLCPKSHTWDGENAEFTPECDDIPWALVPDKKVTVEDLKYIQSSYYQGTPYNPYTIRDTGKRGIYRPIGINRTGVTTICQIRSDVPDPIKGIEWLCFGSNAFNAILPLYTNVTTMPEYLSRVSMETSTENFYWASRLVNVLADPNYGACIQDIERYQAGVSTQGRRLILTYDKKMTENNDFSLTEEANQKLADMAKEKTTAVITKLMKPASEAMKNDYSRSDN